jgi:hypothetical protein
MKLSNAFTILAVTSLAIAKAAATDVGEKLVASRLRGEEGTRVLKKKKKKKKKKKAVYKTQALDVRLSRGEQISLLTNGPLEVFAICTTDPFFIFVVATNDSTEDSFGVFGFTAKPGAVNDIVEEGTGNIYMLWEVGPGSGNMPGVGAIGTSTGFYVSLDGETAIGLVAEQDETQGVDYLDPVYGEETGCVFMGAITMGKNNAWKGKIVEV